MLEVVDDGFTVEVVHGGGQPVPVQALRGTKAAGLCRDGGDGDDLLEGDDLDGGDHADDVDVAGEEGGKEAADHDERPEGTCHEVGLLLLVLGALLVLGGLGLLLWEREEERSVNTLGHNDALSCRDVAWGRAVACACVCACVRTYLLDAMEGMLVLLARIGPDLGGRRAFFAVVAHTGAAAVRDMAVVGLVGELDPSLCARHVGLIVSRWV